jgi:hypothetical protein
MSVIQSCLDGSCVLLEKLTCKIIDISLFRLMLVGQLAVIEEMAIMN